MQRVTLVRYTTKPDRAAENEALSRAVFAQLRKAPPDGIAYALFRDGNEFIHVFLNLREDESAPVTELPTFKAFQDGIAANSTGVSRTTVPVLIIGGENDSLFPPPALEFQAKRYVSSDDVTFKEFANTAHGFLYEVTHPAMVDLVDKWLAKRGG